MRHCKRLASVLFLQRWTSVIRSAVEDHRCKLLLMRTFFSGKIEHANVAVCRVESLLVRM